MRRKLAGLGLPLFCLLALTATDAAAWGSDYNPADYIWDLDYRWPGGVQYVELPGLSICSVGGIFTPRKVTVTETAGPVPVTTTFVYPCSFNLPNCMFSLNYGRGMLKVQVPDARGLLYVNGDPKPMRGSVQFLKTPLLEPGASHVYKLRGVFRSGEKLLIQDKTVSVHAWQRITCVFDGANALTVRLPSGPAKPEVETAPLPRKVPVDP